MVTYVFNFILSFRVLQSMTFTVNELINDVAYVMHDLIDCLLITALALVDLVDGLYLINAMAIKNYHQIPQ